jgi:hypothetical protein
VSRALVLLLLVLCASPRAGAAQQLERARLEAVSIEGCPGLPYPRVSRELWLGSDEAVDVAGGFWLLDRPTHFRGGRALARYRVGPGVLRAESRLDADLAHESVRLEEEQPIAAAFRQVYLRGVALPCERHTRYAVTRLEPGSGDLAGLARFDELLLEAVELQYDGSFDPARQRLEQARALRPDDPAPYWLMARLVYLETEQSAPQLAADERARRFQEVERWADQAVQRAPGQAEGYLWQGVARGRIATSVGNLRIALAGAVGGRGPAWLEQTLRRAVELPDRFRFFGFSTRGDALYALAQFYRLAPDGWYMHLVGTSGDRTRAVQLASEAVRMQEVRIEYRKELAVALLCRGAQGDAEQARRELGALLELPAITALDRVDQEHARALQARVPANVCWYSRDGFVEAGL